MGSGDGVAPSVFTFRKIGCTCIAPCEWLVDADKIFEDADDLLKHKVDSLFMVCWSGLGTRPAF